MHHTATYSPEDNKLRLYPANRLPRDEYDRVKAAGFSWAPKQELFYAPAWTPSREDLLIEMCGEIGDEDTSLVERAEVRAERFEDYSDNRLEEANSAHAAVESISSQIPLGQPILVGHHSEKRARRDAEKIRNGMSRAVRLWETSKYWTERAKGAIRNAKYKELPAVRARRIKGLEAERRKMERCKKDAETTIKLWSREMTHEKALAIAGAGYFYVKDRWTAYDILRPAEQRFRDTPDMTLEEVKQAIVANCTAAISIDDRWLAHLDNRLAYERAMLDESGGLPADQFEFQVGGQVCRRGSWHVITKINRVGGVVNSVSVLGHFASTITVDEIKGYRPPQEGDAQKVAAITATGPICNYPGDGVYGITQDQWDSAHKESKGTSVRKANEQHGTHRVRHLMNWKLRGFGHVVSSQWGLSPVWITDAKRKDPPAPAAAPAPKIEVAPREMPVTRRHEEPEPTVFDAMKESLKAGVQVVSAPQLFPTPRDLADQVVELAGIESGHWVLEPSAGTGALLDPLFNTEGTDWPGGESGRLVVVEVDQNLAKHLTRTYVMATVVCCDFLAHEPPLHDDYEPRKSRGHFYDRIIMNPPFANGADIKHVEHARRFLKPGGRLVAIVAAGPRQTEKYRDGDEPADQWIDLPAGSFAESGTNVDAAIIVING